MRELLSSVLVGPRALLPPLLLSLVVQSSAVAGEPSAVERAEAPGWRAVEVAPVVVAPAVVLFNAHVLTAEGQEHERGYVALRDGTIQAVGAGDPPDFPGATALDLQGAWITPGLIDTHSHLGVYPSPNAKAHSDGNEGTKPTTGGVWAEHSFWPQDPGLRRAIAGGVTTLQILPGSANLIGGRGVIMQVVPTRGSRAMRFPDAPETLKMACGENPKRVHAGLNTRMGNVQGQRTAFIKARSYQAKWEVWRHKNAKARKAHDAWRGKVELAESRGREPKGEAPEPLAPPPDRDLQMETLVGVLEGRVLPQIHCYRADDMLSMMQIADEFDFKIRSFHHALEAYKIRDVLAEREIAVSTWADWWGFKLEAYDGIPQNASMVHQAGGRAVIHSDSGVGIQRLNQEAAKAWRSGAEAGVELDRDAALSWITMNPAWALGIDEQTGSLRAGKRADVVVWDADPFSVYAKAKYVFVAGALRFDAARPQTWSDYRVGQEVGR